MVVNEFKLPTWCHVEAEAQSPDSAVSRLDAAEALEATQITHLARIDTYRPGVVMIQCLVHVASVCTAGRGRGAGSDVGLTEVTSHNTATLQADLKAVRHPILR